MTRRAVTMYLAFAFAATGGGWLGSALAVDSSEADVPRPITKAGALFQDNFDRDDLGEQYEVLAPDPNRIAVSDGKLLIVGTSPRKNLVLSREKFAGDFMATVAVTMQVTDYNALALGYWVDEKSYLAIGIAGVNSLQKSPWAQPEPAWRSRWRDRRAPFFTKVIEGQRNNILPSMSQLGDRQLEGFADKPETWYLQLHRVGAKYTGRISADGVNWIRLGTHGFVQKYGQLGFKAQSGGGVENVAEFDDLVVQGSR